MLVGRPVDAFQEADKLLCAVTRQTLAEVVEPRIEELFELVRNELRRSGFEELMGSGVVLTGGSSKMDGMVELAEEVFHMPVRIGMPKSVQGLTEAVRNPIYSTGVGLIQFGHANQAPKLPQEPKLSTFGGVLSRMKTWFQGGF